MKNRVGYDRPFVHSTGLKCNVEFISLFFIIFFLLLWNLGVAFRGFIKFKLARKLTPGPGPYFMRFNLHACTSSLRSWFLFFYYYYYHFSFYFFLFSLRGKITRNGMCPPASDEMPSLLPTYPINWVRNRATAFSAQACTRPLTTPAQLS